MANNFFSIDRFYKPVMTGAILIAALALFEVGMELSFIRTWPEDSLHYLHSYFFRLASEGRWINYFFFNSLQKIPLHLAMAFDFALLFSFFYILIYKVTKNHLYTLLLAFLFMQACPIHTQIYWPNVILPAHIVLFSAAIAVRFLPVYVFYLLYGLLFWGTMQGYYYLLPLLHINLYTKGTFKENTLFYIKKILPFWALGFLAGYGVSLSIAYIYSGNWGFLPFAPRYSTPAQDMAGLWFNIQKSAAYFIQRAKVLVGHWPVLLALTLALGVCIFSKQKKTLLSLLLPLTAIILAHNILVIPWGHLVDLRTLLAAWIAFLCFFFLHGFEKKQQLLLVPILVFLTLFFTYTNYNMAHAFQKMRNVLFNELKEVVPEPEKYAGAIFVTPLQERIIFLRLLENTLQLKRGPGRPLNQLESTGLAVGFKILYVCEKEYDPVCYSVGDFRQGKTYQPKNAIVVNKKSFCQNTSKENCLLMQETFIVPENNSKNIFHIFGVTDNNYILLGLNTKIFTNIRQ